MSLSQVLLECAWRDSRKATHVCDMTFSVVCDTSCTDVEDWIHVSDVTHLYKIIFVTWLTYRNSYVWCDSLIKSHTRDVTALQRLMCVRNLNNVYVQLRAPMLKIGFIFVTWLTYKNSNVWRDSLIETHKCDVTIL